ncbi:MAG: hypothetical protein WDZ35_00115 [Crocinitomicaceae bacterium]
MRIFLLIISLSVLSDYAASQDTKNAYAQFKIRTISTQEQAREIDAKIKSKKGIISAHADYITSTYFCTFKTEASYTEAHFVKWFKKLGYEIDCFNSGISGDGKMIAPQGLKDC